MSKMHRQAFNALGYSHMRLSISPAKGGEVLPVSGWRQKVRKVEASRSVSGLAFAN